MGPQTTKSKSSSDDRNDGSAPAARRRVPTDTSPWRRRFNTIYETLRERITLLHYPPGSRLVIDALVEEFDVSRTPIRTVLQRLESDGLAITRHGVGTEVTEIDFEHVREAMQLRMYMAELMGTLNPREPDEATLLSLENLLQECALVKDERTAENFARIDMRLHGCKCRLIGNEPLKRTYDELFYRTARTWFYLLPRMEWATEFGALWEDTLMTTRALERGDVRAVGLITRNAISVSLFRLDDLLLETDTMRQWRA